MVLRLSVAQKVYISFLSIFKLIRTFFPRNKIRCSSVMLIRLEQCCCRHSQSISMHVLDSLAAALVSVEHKIKNCMIKSTVIASLSQTAKKTQTRHSATNLF